MIGSEMNLFKSCSTWIAAPGQDPTPPVVRCIVPGPSDPSMTVPAGITEIVAMRGEWLSVDVAVPRREHPKMTRLSRVAGATTEFVGGLK
jgi:hypothetical protein